VCFTFNKAFKSDSQRLAVSLRSSIAKRRSHLNAALCCQRLSMKILILFIAALLSGCAGLIESASSPNYREHKARDSVSPRNHKSSRRNKLVGTVVLTFNINSQGDVIDIMVTDSVPKGVFDAEAVRILSKRKYAPSEKGETGPKKAKFEFKI